jgi:hypothetical protein
MAAKINPEQLKHFDRLKVEQEKVIIKLIISSIKFDEIRNCVFVFVKYLNVCNERLANW